MTLTELARIAIGGALTGVLTWAAVSDIRFRVIPNRAVVAVLGLFVVWAAAGRGVGLVSGLEAAAAAFIVTVAMYAFKIVGAGDAKLFTAVALFAGVDLLPYLAFATAMTGGVIAAVSLASRPTRALVMFTLRGKGDYGRGVPYGVAIAIGGAIVTWGGLAHLLPLAPK